MNIVPVKENLVAATERWKKFNWFIHLLVGLVGVVVVGSVGFGYYKGAQVYQKYFPSINASMEMRLEATTAYLWFEEMLGGDKSKNMGDIMRHLDQADRYAKAMIEGEKSVHLKLLPFKEAHFRDSIEILQRQLTKQRKLLHMRMAALSNAGPGSDIDKLYHSTLENFVARANKFEIEIKAIMIHEYRQIKILCICVVALCIFLFFIIGFGFYHYERLRIKNYSEILKMERLLIQSEKMAALGTMISGIAHEINNPNTFISFNIPILKEYVQELIHIIDDYAEANADFRLFDMTYKEFRDDLYKLIKNVENGSSRINRIVTDLKEFNKKKDQIKRIWFNLEAVIQRIMRIYGSNINSSVDLFKLKVAEELPEVYCDPEIIELILINFLNNAAEAADKQDCWIKLNVFAHEKNPNAVIIEVRDNGRGINESDIHRIFDPFFSTKSSKGGTGMGLYLCRSLADQIDVRIEVESEAGKGSVFRLITNENEKPKI